MNKFLLPLILIFTSCSFAPLTSTKTARSLGEGKWEVSTGFSPALNVNVGKGITEKVDAGIIVEQQFSPVVALWGKYSFSTSAEDSAFAAYGGVFKGSGTSDSSGFFFGPVASYKKKWFEIYFLPVFNYVKWEAGSLTLEDQDDSFFDEINWQSSSLKYMQYTLGVNFWFTEGFALNISGKTWSFFDDNVKSEGISPGLEFIWNF